MLGLIDHDSVGITNIHSSKSVAAVSLWDLREPGLTTSFDRLLCKRAEQIVVPGGSPSRCSKLVNLVDEFEVLNEDASLISNGARAPRERRSSPTLFGEKR